MARKALPRIKIRAARDLVNGSAEEAEIARRCGAGGEIELLVEESYPAVSIPCLKGRQEPTRARAPLAGIFLTPRHVIHNAPLQRRDHFFRHRTPARRVVPRGRSLRVRDHRIGESNTGWSWRGLAWPPPGEKGSRVELDRVLLISDGSTVRVGHPTVSGARVVSEILAQTRG
jgi:hypothetical protein